MPHLTRARREHMRWLCLECLDHNRPATMLDMALLALIQMTYPDANDIELRRALDYLETRGLLTITKIDVRWQLRLTYQGVDLVEYTSVSLPGIGRPATPD